MPICALLSKHTPASFSLIDGTILCPNSSLSGLPLHSLMCFCTLFYNHSAVCRVTGICVGSDKQIASPFRSVFPLCVLTRGTLNYQLQTEAQLTTKPHTGGTAKQQQLETGPRFTIAWRVPRGTATRSNQQITLHSSSAQTCTHNLCKGITAMTIVKRKE